MKTINTTRSFAEIEHSTVRKVSKRLIPFLFLCFAISILDRLNISFAALQMNETLDFSNEVYGLGAGIFFIGYFLLEVPGGALMTRFGARKWISRIMISWGIISGLTAFVTTPAQFYAVRFALGVAEASFFPCMAWYLSQWYQTKHHARALAGFMAAIPVASALGSPISGYLLTLDLWGFHGWQNLFILEAIPSVILGVITFFYLTDKIEDAKWLEQDEKEWLTKILAKEEAIKRKKKSITFLQALKERDVLILACAYFCWMAGYYGVIMFLPTLIHSLSSSMETSMLGWLIGFMYLLAAITMVSVGRSSDKRQERRFHVATSLIVSAIGLVISVYVAEINTIFAIVIYTISLCGAYGAYTPFWAIPPSYLSGSAVAAGIALINSVGNLGGFFGPYLLGALSSSTGSYTFGIFALAGFMIISSLIVIFVIKQTGKVVNS